MQTKNLARGVLFALTILCLPIAGAFAEGELDGTWKAPPIGTKAAYNYGANWEVVAVKSDRVFVIGDPGNKIQNVSWHKYKGIIDSINDEGWKRSINEAAIDKLFPLKVGNKTTVSAPSGDWDLRVTYKVTGIKQIETLAGVRTVYRIAFLERGDDNHRAKGFGYFDPELGIWHRGIYTYQNNDPYKWKLISLELPE